MSNVRKCEFCGSTDVQRKTLDVPINKAGVVSVKVNGDKCMNCGEEYYDSNDLLVIEQIEKALSELSVGA